MEYNDYEVTEVEFDKIKAQHLAGKIIEDQVYYVKELNRLYKINHLLRIKSVIILESRIVDDRQELINKKAYINGKLHSEYHYNGEMSTEKIYSKTDKLGTKTVIRYYKNGIASNRWTSSRVRRRKMWRLLLLCWWTMDN